MSRNWHSKHVPGGIAIGEESSFTRRVVLINPTEKGFYTTGYNRNRRGHGAYVLWFGAYGTTRLLVYADSLESALEECAAWLAERAPGLIMPMGSEEYNDLLAHECEERGLVYPPPADADTEPYWKAEESAMVDQTSTESGYIASWEWGIALENPTTEQLYAYIRGE